ncbi:polyketide cyclase/dehydrase/lipid transport protein [Paraburkholderia unamae]|uniref:SRPBCC family protein n=1 Tax=Paraburkholderia unamae TaxID=219649 RepID=UPI000DC313E8|nr:SRPBCC family protein [Paraburkholderia unamae]RAR53550.1 polyketide cyclase/dehydrase/lipid transport protein [Paraburkholderia unamae]
MAQANASIRIPVSPDVVWGLIGGFNSLPDWLPYIPSSELSEGGRVRRLANPGGDVIVERLEAFDHRARSYTYSILEAPFPVTGYRSTLQVREIEGGRAAQVDWSGEFTPQGVSDEEASRLFEGIYRDGLQALAASFADKGRA